MTPQSNSKLTRTDKVALVRELRDEGLLWKEISLRLGIPRSTAHELYADPDRVAAKTRKLRYDGVCVDCGGKTRYGSSGPYERCDSCSRARRARAKRVARDARGLEMIALRRQGLLNYEIGERLGCSEHSVAQLLYQMARDGHDVPISPWWKRAAR